MGRTAAWVAALVLVAAMNGGAWAQASAPAPAPNPISDPCIDVVLTNLSACLDFVDPGNNTTPASNSDCCTGMGDFLTLSPQCICYLLKTDLTDVLGLAIDRGKALNLPNVCKKKLPLSELSKCSGTGSTAAANIACLEPVAEKLIPCVDYVDPASKKTKPPSDGGCCSGLRAFLKEDFDCLCSLVNANPGDFPISIDRTKVLQLPGFCNATIPSFRCSGNTTLSAPENKCLTPVVSKLASCIDYVDPASNTTKPAAKGECCGGLQGFLKDEFSCICSLINLKPGDYPVPIDRVKVLSLPAACNATIPSLKCSGVVTSPAPENNCLMPVVQNLATCVDYVDPGINKSEGPVRGDCCNGLRSFLENQPRCICPIVEDKTDEYPISIDMAKAFTLAKNCNVSLTEISQCLESDSPASITPDTPSDGAQPGFTPSATALLAGATLVIAAAFF